ncbi:MAG: 4Fe-4S binding protein [Candidatus Neomarinimicrobiota bacterium]
MKKNPVVTINEKWCKSCGICVHFCPKKVLEMGQFNAVVVHPEQCIGCRMCENLCPDFAVTVVIEEETK